MYYMWHMYKLVLKFKKPGCLLGPWIFNNAMELLKYYTFPFCQTCIRHVIKCRYWRQKVGVNGTKLVRFPVPLTRIYFLM